MKVILAPDRLFLREYVEEDAEAFFKLNRDPDVLRFVPDKQLLNVEQARQILVDHPIADYRKYGFGRGACILKSNRRTDRLCHRTVVGRRGLGSFHDTDRHEEESTWIDVDRAVPTGLPRANRGPSAGRG